MNRLLGITTTALLLVLVPLQVASAAKLYRWVDESGQVHYGYTVPPAYVKQGSDELSNRGRTVSSTPRAKTQEEIAEEKRIAAEKKRLAAKEAERKHKQDIYDSILVRTYGSAKEIEMVRDRNLEAIDASIITSEGRIEKLSGDLGNRKKEAATQERRGKAISATMRDGIAMVQSQIAENRAFIENKRVERAQLVEKYAKAMERFLQLRPTR
ncbi:hypothetical protein BOW53_09860 [Solemya pervernicosa gill symbiont]|uniref:DUF4124 domain-containing protein n=2 Tax=Gammaproteobacteria incertae sedis TaxID=118884 RepID=A0A1T2L461_9GAMM|nr:DUF4124 domain-containing protein [Candidatus Reidiella endopervernicosa]OOZ39897.1 hypothetical protein BOW53_09860 [Solemya pervernicosa gill symbiont]QKQ25779.1 DUF4124 domain-containing protein [Candidatus Reidiella endopervernicosa]